MSQNNVAAGTRAALIPDIQGSVIASIDSASDSLSRIGYQPYGKSASVLIATAPGITRRRGRGFCRLIRLGMQVV